MKIPSKKELQARHSKLIRHHQALVIAVGTLSVIAAATPPVVHPGYSKAANVALKKIQKLIYPRK